jgi:hypothetical protein
MNPLFLVGLAAVMQQPESRTISVAIEVRQSIQPALAPYIECLNQSQARLSQRAGPLRSVAMRRVVEQARNRCARSRTAAAARALRLIATDNGVPAGQAPAIVSAAFASVDASDEAFLQELARAERSGDQNQ